MVRLNRLQDRKLGNGSQEESGGEMNIYQNVCMCARVGKAPEGASICVTNVYARQSQFPSIYYTT